MAYHGLFSRSIDREENRQPEMLRATIPFIILATFSVVARYFSRRLRKTSLGADDFLVLLALILAWGDFGIVLVDIHFSVGKHTEKGMEADVAGHYHAAFASGLIYASSLAATKMSILFFYQRIFPTRSILIATRIIGGIVVAWWIVCVVVQIFSCHPINGFWDTSIPATCIDSAHFYIAAAIPNILTDVALLALPVRMIWRLQTSAIQKTALSITFLTGAFVVIASLCRVIQVHKANRTDSLWTYTEVAIWSSIEPSVAVVSACLPTLRPLFREMWFNSKTVRNVVRFVVGTISSTRQDEKIELGSHGRKPENIRPSHNTERNDSLWSQPGDKISGDKMSRETIVKAANPESDPERDDRLLWGINVPHDVQVERYTV